MTCTTTGRMVFSPLPAGQISQPFVFVRSSQQISRDVRHNREMGQPSPKFEAGNSCLYRMSRVHR